MNIIKRIIRKIIGEPTLSLREQLRREDAIRYKRRMAYDEHVSEWHRQAEYLLSEGKKLPYMKRYDEVTDDDGNLL